MNIIPIFEVDSITKEGLYAIQYDGEEQNELDRLFDLWLDNADYVLNYLVDNQFYLNNNYFKGESIDIIASRIRQEAKELTELLTEFSYRIGERRLQEVFRPLSDGEFIIRVHQKTKTSIENWKYRRAILRIYAIRIGPNTYVVTGGAIKLVKPMSDHEDTGLELQKFEKVKRYLASIELYSEDDLTYVL